MSTISRRGAIRLGGVFALATTSAVALPASAGADPITGWKFLPPPTVDGADRLIAVAASSHASAWAVGGERTAAGTERSLTARWDGTSWAAVPSPGETPLNAVATVSDTDAWAVGSAVDGSRSVIQRWNGGAWTLVPHVSAGLSLQGVVALGPGNAIAVGYRGELFAATPHAQHWDGQRWRELPVPGPAGVVATVLTSVAVGQGSVWAAGFVADQEFRLYPYFVRWDGTQWTDLPVPWMWPGAISDLVVLGPDQVVGAGSAPSGDGGSAPIIVTNTAGVWGREGMRVDSAELNGIAHDGRGNLFVVGDRIGPGGHDDRRPIVLKRRPFAPWEVETLGVLGEGGLRDVAMVTGSSQAFAVGAWGVTDETHRSIILGHHIITPRP